MNLSAIKPIRNKIAAAAGDLAHCDTEDLRDIALEILCALAETKEPTLTPSTRQRKVLCDVVQHLISNEAFGRSSWRLSAAQTALRIIEPLASGEIS